MPFYWDRPDLPYRRQLAFIANPWLRIQVRIGEASHWPADIRRVLWCSYLGYRHRIHLVTFFYLNGVTLLELVELVRFCNPVGSTQSHIRRIIDLYVYIQNNPRVRDRYFAFDLILRRVVNLNGLAHLAPPNFLPLANPPPRDRNQGVRPQRRPTSPQGYHC